MVLVYLKVSVGDDGDGKCALWSVKVLIQSERMPNSQFFEFEVEVGNDIAYLKHCRTVVMFG